MDRDQFDSIVKQVAAGGSRRGALHLLVGSAFAPILARIGVADAGAAPDPAPADCQNIGRKCEKGGRRCCGNSICKNNRCRCESNKKRCKGRCIRKNKCCRDKDCGACSRCGDNGRCTTTCGPCQTCNASGSCVSTCGACQSCNASGVCAPTCGLGQTCQNNRCVCQQAERAGNTEVTASGVRLISDPSQPAANQFGALRFGVPGNSVAFADITRLQTTFNPEQGCRPGSPRFSLVTDQPGKSVFVYPSPDNNCTPGSQDSGNLIGANGQPFYDTSQLSGGNPRQTYDQAKATIAAANARIARIVFVVDGSFTGSTQSVVVNSICVQVAGGNN